MNAEVRSLRRLAALVGECEKIGMPVIAESIPGGWAREVPWDAEHIAWGARVCVEIGADAIKTMAPPDVDDLARRGGELRCPPVRPGRSQEWTARTRRSTMPGCVVEAGASGIAFGRNTWGAADPTGMVRRLYEAVHGHSPSSLTRYPTHPGPRRRGVAARTVLRTRGHSVPTRIGRRFCGGTGRINLGGGTCSDRKTPGHGRSGCKTWKGHAAAAGPRERLQSRGEVRETRSLLPGFSTGVQNDERHYAESALARLGCPGVLGGRLRRYRW